MARRHTTGVRPAWLLRWMAMIFGSVMASTANGTPSRPTPERLLPPKGIASMRKSPVSLIITAPTRSRWATSSAASRSRVKTPACRPYSEAVHLGHHCVGGVERLDGDHRPEDLLGEHLRAPAGTEVSTVGQ